MINKRRLIKTFKKLVRIDSLSLCEGKVARYLQRELRSIGIRSRQAGWVRVGEVGNIVAFVPGKKYVRPRLLLNAHIDTVSPGKNVKPVKKKGYIRSFGQTILGADNKAGVAAILEILRTIKEKKLNHPPLKIIFTVAEEIGLLGAKALPEKVLNADYGLVLDGGDINAVINKAPAQYNLTAKIFGRAAHAGIHPEEGINAIKVAGEAIARMKIGRIDKETTSNIGMIKGGKATNIVPEEVELSGEARSHNMKKLERQVEHMERTLLKASQKYRARLKLKVERMYKSFEIDKSSKVVLLVMRGMKAVGIKPVIKQTGGGSDANIFNEWGIPTVILGVGADRVHTQKERIRVEDLIKGTKMILNVITGAGEEFRSGTPH